MPLRELIITSSKVPLGSSLNIKGKKSFDGNLFGSVNSLPLSTVIVVATSEIAPFSKFLSLTAFGIFWSTNVNLSFATILTVLSLPKLISSSRPLNINVKSEISGSSLSKNPCFTNPRFTSISEPIKSGCATTNRLKNDPPVKTENTVGSKSGASGSSAKLIVIELRSVTELSDSILTGRPRTSPVI